MGCHTWFYAKSNKTQEEANKEFIYNAKDYVKYCDKIALKVLKHKTGQKRLQQDVYKRITKDYIDSYFNRSSLEQYTFDKKLYLRMIRMVKKGLCQRAVWNHLNDLGLYIDGKGYYTEVDFHNLFRVHNYPKDVLTSLEECLDFIKKHNIDNVNYERLNEFWNKYPDGAVDFG